MRRSSLAFALAAVAAPAAHAQTSAYVEVGGNTVGIGVHLEQGLTPRLALSAGVAKPLLDGVYVPVHAHYLTRPGLSGGELAVGATVAVQKSGTEVAPSGYAGYRWQRPSGLLFRAGVGLIVVVDGDSVYPIPVPGVSIGRRF